MFLFVLTSNFLHAVKSCTLGALVLCFERKVAAHFYRRSNPSPQPGLKLRTLGPNSKHPNNYSTEVTVSSYTGFMPRRVLELKFKGNRLIGQSRGRWLYQLLEEEEGEELPINSEGKGVGSVSRYM
jgi:hypothetical protein